MRILPCFKSIAANVDWSPHRRKAGRCCQVARLCTTYTIIGRRASSLMMKRFIWQAYREDTQQYGREKMSSSAQRMIEIFYMRMNISSFRQMVRRDIIWCYRWLHCFYISVEARPRFQMKRWPSFHMYKLPPMAWRENILFIWNYAYTAWVF